MRFLFMIAFALPGLALSATADVRAAVEFCPATASVPMPAGAAFGTAARTFHYGLTALTPRTVNVTLIADTTGGWFAWNAGNVSLASVRRPYHSSWLSRAFQVFPYIVAASPTLTVSFPAAVLVRHMWITSAGASACDVPPFDGPSDTLPPNADDVSASTSPNYPAAVAAPVNTPFAGASCDQPFAPITVTKALAPDLSFGLYEGTVGLIASVVSVAVDPAGGVLDAWTLASSGNARFDRASVRAARLSTYTGSISYCRPTRGTYQFVTTLVPHG